MSEISRLIPNFRRDDLPPERFFPLRRPFDLAAKQFRIRGAVIGQGEDARFKFFVANEHQNIQLRHASKRARCHGQIRRGGDNHRNIRERHGAFGAVLAILNVKLIKLQPHPQMVTEKM